MNSVSKCFALLALLTPALGAAAGGSTIAQERGPALQAHWGGTLLKLNRRLPGVRREPVVKELAAGSTELAAAREVDLGATPAGEEYNELRQSLALLTDGSYASVWTERTGDSLDVRMQWVRPDGSLVFAGGGRTVADEPDNEFNAVIAANPAGGAFVAFSRVYGNGDRLQVLAQSYDAAGNPRWAADGVFAANVSSGNFQEQPQLIAAPGGGVYLCTEEFHSSGEDVSDIRCQRLGASGQRLWTDEGVRAGGRLGWKVLPKLIRDNRNGVMVFWRNLRDAFDHPQDRVLIEGQHLAPDGTRTWGTQGRILRTTNLPASGGGGYHELGAVSDGQGGAVVSFDDWNGRSAINRDVYAQRVTGDGRLLWGNGTAVAVGSAPQQHDSVTAAPDGGAFVTFWVPLSNQLRLARLDAGGKVRWTQPLASTDSGSNPNDYGAYGSLDNGRLRIAWTHQRQDATFTMDVYLAIFDLAGHRLNGPAATPLTTAQDAQFARGFVFDPARKQGFAVWDDRRNGTWDDLDAVGGLYKE